MSVVEMVSMTGEFLLLAARLSIAISAMVDAHHCTGVRITGTRTLLGGSLQRGLRCQHVC
jgi:hypothetical protein